MKDGGQLVVDALEDFGTDRIFCVPGESFLPVLNALYDSDIEVTTCRQEGGASMMAEATGKLTKKPGICIVTRAPGATNASAGVHIASQDSTPMILLIGQIATNRRYRETFQELNYESFFGDMAKWVAEISHTSRIPEMMSRAWHVATNGRPGPVVLSLPEDVLSETIDVPNIKLQFNRLESCPSESQINQCVEILQNAKRPLAVLGGSLWTEQSVNLFTKFAEEMGLPVACSFRRQMLFNHSHPNYIGDIGLGINPALASQIKESDCLLLLGARFSEIPSQDFSLLDVPVPQCKLIHVYPDSSEIGKLYSPTLGVIASPAVFTELLSKVDLPHKKGNDNQIESSRRAYQQWSSLSSAVPEAKTMKVVMQTLIDLLPADSIICNGAGNYASWIHRFYPFQSFNSQLAPTSGSMGYGLPSAVAAKLQYPERTVVAVAGDGCLQMTMQELGTAMQYNLTIIILVIDNGMYGTIRMHQEKHYPERISGTSIANPDFSLLAKSYGAIGLSADAANFAEVFSKALAEEKVTLVHVSVEPYVLSPTLVI